MKHTDVFCIHIPGIDFTIHPCLAHPPRNQLSVLGTEIKDQDSVGMDVVMGVHSQIRLEYTLVAARTSLLMQGDSLRLNQSTR
jgi:hypothetical protein